jgi:hypothetical protein
MTDDFVEKFLSEYNDDQNQKEIEQNETAKKQSLAAQNESKILQLAPSSYSEIVSTIQSYVAKINEGLKPNEKFRIEAKTFDLTLNFSGYVIWLHSKFKATKGRGTDPCIEIFFGREGTSVGNGAPTKVLIPTLDGGSIVWQIESSRQRIGSAGQVAKFVLQAMRAGKM